MSKVKKVHNRVEIEGKVFNNWKVIEHSHTNNKIPYYNCICLSCKIEYTVDGRNIRSGKSKQCVKCGREKTRLANLGLKKSKETRKKISESKKGIKLTSDHVKKLKGFKKTQCDQKLLKLDPTPAQGARGLRISKRLNEIKQKAKARKKKWELTKYEAAELLLKNCSYCGEKPNPYTGIDRIDSSKGYIKDNVTSCCQICNRAKNDSSLEDFKDWVAKTYKHLYKTGQ